MQPYEERSYRKIIKPFAVLLAVVVILLVAYNLFRDTQFHVVSTNPSTSSVATASPFFKINFNKKLSNKVSLTSDYSIVKSYKVEGKTLVINFNPPLTVGRAYYIKLITVFDTGNKEITNQVFTFVPKIVPAQDLPKDQQEAILQNQANKTPNVSNINFVGTGALINNGLTSGQVFGLEQAFFQYKPLAKIVSINTASVEPAPRNPNTATSFTFNFTVTIDSTPYNASISYTEITNIELTLYNPANNAQVFNSGLLNTLGND